MERRTKIVATIGPASREPEVLVRMVEAGVGVARLNFSPRPAQLHAQTAPRGGGAARPPGPPGGILPAVPEEDLEHLRAGQKIGVDLVALSFVRRPEDVLFVREHTRTPLIAKIEKPQGVERAEEILKVSDCVMVARGDLGVEMPIEEVPMIQKRLLALAGSMARPSITATQMLDSM